MDLAQLTDRELQWLQNEIPLELERREKEECRAQEKKEAVELVKRGGFTMAELFELAVAQRRKKK